MIENIFTVFVIHVINDTLLHVGYAEPHLPGKPDTRRRFSATTVLRRKSSDGVIEQVRQQCDIRFWLEPMARVDVTVTSAITERFMKELLVEENFGKGE